VEYVLDVIVEEPPGFAVKVALIFGSTAKPFKPRGVDEEGTHARDDIVGVLYNH
jgi:hypothetical protein